MVNKMSCPHCGRTIGADGTLADQQGLCPHCHQTLTIRDTFTRSPPLPKKPPPSAPVCESESEPRYQFWARNPQVLVGFAMATIMLVGGLGSLYLGEGRQTPIAKPLRVAPTTQAPQQPAKIADVSRAEPPGVAAPADIAPQVIEVKLPADAGLMLEAKFAAVPDANLQGEPQPPAIAPHAALDPPLPVAAVTRLVPRTIKVQVDTSKNSIRSFRTADPQKLIDYLKGRGHEVSELSPAIPSVENLLTADLIVRFDPCAPTSDAEIQAYEGYVNAGGVVLLAYAFGDGADPVGKALGVTYGGTIQASKIPQWADIFPGRELSETPFKVGCAIKELPPNATQLAWLPPTNLDVRCVMASFPVGAGHVWIVTTIMPLVDRSQPFCDLLFDCLTGKGPVLAGNLPLPPGVVPVNPGQPPVGVPGNPGQPPILPGANVAQVVAHRLEQFGRLDATRRVYQLDEERNLDLIRTHLPEAQRLQSMLIEIERISRTSALAQGVTSTNSGGGGGTSREDRERREERRDRDDDKPSTRELFNREQAILNAAERRLWEIRQAMPQLQVAWFSLSDRFGTLSRAEQESALAKFDEWMAINGVDPSTLLTRGLTYQHCAQPDKALADFDKAIHWLKFAANNGGTNPANRVESSLQHLTAAAYAMRGYLHLVEGREKAAEEDFRAAGGTTSAKTSVEYLLFRGMADTHEGKYTTARALWRVAAQLAPTAGEPYRLQALLGATCTIDAQRNGKRAVDNAEKACEHTQQRDWASVYALAAACAEAGDFDRAIAEATRAAELTFDENRRECRRCADEYRQKRPLRLPWK